jgi:ribonuclease HI
MVVGVPLLTAARSSISLYADASYSTDLEVGCWAFSIPTFPLERAGIEGGVSNNHLELAAVVHGLAALVALDFGKHAVHIHTDSEFVIGILQYASSGAPLPSRRSYKAVTGLYDRMCDLSSGRVITATRQVIGNAHHAACDRRARHDLRKYCSEGRFSRTILLKRAEAHRRSLERQLKQVERSLDTVHQKLLRCEIEIATLRSVQCTTEHASSAVPAAYAHV